MYLSSDSYVCSYIHSLQTKCIVNYLYTYIAWKKLRFLMKNSVIAMCRTIGSQKFSSVKNSNLLINSKKIPNFKQYLYVCM